MICVQGDMIFDLFEVWRNVDVDFNTHSEEELEKASKHDELNRRDS